jgi:hypothetical protein
MQDDILDIWTSPAEALPLLKPHFTKLKTFQWHLWRRERNGLLAADAVRMTPFGRLIVNPKRIRAWAMGEGTQQAA